MTKQRELLLASIENLRTKQRELFISALEKLTGSIELRDAYTGKHSQRVTSFAILLGQQLDLSAEDLELIRIGTPLHDLGKIGIADAILRKPARLTTEEFEVMKTHTTKGADIIQLIPDLRPILNLHSGTGSPALSCRKARQLRLRNEESLMRRKRFVNARMATGDFSASSASLHGRCATAHDCNDRPKIRLHP